jgi:hypothetical protein
MGLSIVTNKSEEINDEEEALSPREVFMGAIIAVITFLGLFFVSSIYVNFILFRVKTRPDTYENQFLPSDENESPYQYAKVDSDNNLLDTDNDNFFRRVTHDYLKVKQYVNEGCDKCDHPIKPNCNPHGKRDTHGWNICNNIYINTVYWFRLFMNTILGLPIVTKFIINHHASTNVYGINWWRNYIFTLFTPLLLGIFTSTLFPIITTASAVWGLFHTIKDKCNCSRWGGFIGLVYIILFVVLLPFVIIGFPPLLTLGLICSMLYSIIKPHDNIKFDVDDQKERGFSILTNFITYLPINVMLSSILFLVAMIPIINSSKSDVFKPNTWGADKFGLFVMILGISIVSAVISYVISSQMK